MKISYISHFVEENFSTTPYKKVVHSTSLLQFDYILYIFHLFMKIKFDVTKR